MKAEFWHKKWDKKEIGFNQLNPSMHLERHWSQFTESRSGKVFVPLCGKSIDMIYLNKLGHQVLGCELSKVAIEEFYEENKLNFTIDGNEYVGEGIKIKCSNLFDINSADLTDIKFVYDRASLVALTYDQRMEYYTWMRTHLRPKGIPVFLDVVRFTNKEVGPPFSIQHEELQSNLGEDFEIKLIQEIHFTGDQVFIHKGKISEYKTVIYFITPK